MNLIPIVVPMDVEVDNVLVSMDVATDQVLMPMEVAVAYTIGGEAYDGAYEFTPTEQAQTIEIENKRALENITIKPIPNNYGLITWDGITLTVS